MMPFRNPSRLSLIPGLSMLLCVSHSWPVPECRAHYPCTQVWNRNPEIQNESEWCRHNTTPNLVQIDLFQKTTSPLCPCCISACWRKIFLNASPWIGWTSDLWCGTCCPCSDCMRFKKTNISHPIRMSTCRLPPEVVVAAMCKWLSMNVLWRAAQFLYGFGSRREKELRLHSMLKEDQRLLHLCQPRKVSSKSNLPFDASVATHLSLQIKEMVQAQQILFATSVSNHCSESIWRVKPAKVYLKRLKAVKSSCEESLTCNFVTGFGDYTI